MGSYPGGPGDQFSEMQITRRNAPILHMINSLPRYLSFQVTNSKAMLDPPIYTHIKHGLYKPESSRGGIKRRPQANTDAEKNKEATYRQPSLPPHILKLVLAADAVLRTRVTTCSAAPAVSLLEPGPFPCRAVILLTLPVLTRRFLERLVRSAVCVTFGVICCDVRMSPGFGIGGDFSSAFSRIVSRTGASAIGNRFLLALLVAHTGLGTFWGLLSSSFQRGVWVEGRN